MTGYDIVSLDAAGFDAHLDGLAELLAACVAAGASVSFVSPFSVGDAARFWRERVRPGVEAGTRTVLAAVQEGVVAGTVQLDRATPPNQPHRADVSKLLVHPDRRKQGMARALMIGLEDAARASGRWLMTLDTASAVAEHLYSSLGYRTAGAIPEYALNSSGGVLEATIIMYKSLRETG